MESDCIQINDIIMVRYEENANIITLKKMNNHERLSFPLYSLYSHIYISFNFASLIILIK